MTIFVPAISFSGGKFVLSESASVKSKQPWEKYIIPNAKTDRLKFFNAVTKEVYNTAFISKQSRFQSYLDGQRRFRWEVSCEVDKLEKVLHAYKEGTIPKENISCDRYMEFPRDVKVEDVPKCQRVLAHVSDTLSLMKNVNKKLLNRKKELFNEELKPKPWAASEISFVNKYLEVLGRIIGETQQMTLDIEHVMQQLEKRFDRASVASSEEKRKARRKIEQRYKAKRKRVAVAKKENEENCTSDDNVYSIDSWTNEET